MKRKNKGKANPKNCELKSKRGRENEGEDEEIGLNTLNTVMMV